MRLHAREVYAFVGKRGTGKSTRAKAFVARLQHKCIAFDMHDEWSRQGRATKEVRLGPLRESMPIGNFFERSEELLDDPHLSLALVCSSSPREAAEEFKLLMPIVRHTGGLVFVVEEIGHWGEYAHDELNELACQSRHDEVPLVLVAQRAIQIPKTTRTQITTLNSGRQDDPADLRALAEVMGPQHSDRVACLAEGEFVEWHDTDWTKSRKQHPTSHNGVTQ